MMAGLDEVSFLIGFYSYAWKGLFSDQVKAELQQHILKLYTSILLYQAKLLSHLSKNSAIRFARNAVKTDDWVQYLSEVKKNEARCTKFGAPADVRAAQEARDGWARTCSQLMEDLEISKEILAALVDIRQQNLQKLSAEQDMQRIKLVRSLFSDYRRQKETNPKQVPGTCKWFTNDKRFCQWRDAKESQLLHVYAGPGCGKSVLARYLIDDCLVTTSKNQVVLYFFFKDGQEGQQKCENAIAALLHQLYTEISHRSTFVHALPKYEACGDRLREAFDELWEILIKTIEDPTADEVVCVLDALDECVEDDRLRLMQKVTEYFSRQDINVHGAGRLKMLITSRRYSSIDVEYELLTDNSSFVRLDGSEHAELIAQEINRVIEVKVPAYIPRIAKTVQVIVIKHLQGMENRTYLWLHFVLDFIKKNISGNGTEEGVKSLIERLPPGVNEAYEGMLRRSSDYAQAKMLLHIVLAARIPLEISEIKVALAVTRKSYDRLEDIQKATEADEQFENSLNDLCGLMLNVQDSRVYLIHQTAREYLTQSEFSLSNRTGSWQGPVSLNVAEEVMARACITFLCLANSQLRESRGRADFELYKWSMAAGLATGKPLSTWLDYALRFSPAHIRDAPESLQDTLLPQLLQLCRAESDLFRHIIGFETSNWALTESDIIRAASLGLEKVVDALLEEGANVEECHLTYPRYSDGWMTTALREASTAGHVKVVKLLLDEGANVNASQTWSFALRSAVLGADGEMIGKILKGEADAFESPRQSSALVEAALQGHKEVVNLLLSRGADVDQYCEALFAACSGGHESIVQAFLDSRVKINVEGRNDGALAMAARRGHEGLVKLLLGHGAHINAQSRHYGTALNEAASTGHNTIVGILLDHDADIHAQDRIYGTALQAAARAGDEKVLQMLFDGGVDVNAQPNDTACALQSAAEKGREALVETLLDKGADVDALSGYYGTALQAASYGGHEAVVKILLNKGADVDALSGSYGTALQAASLTGHEAVVKILLNKGADVDALSGYYGTALQAASYGRHEAVVKILLNKGADVNAQGGEWGSALQAASPRPAAIVELLLEAGANANIQGGRHGPALCLAVGYPCEDVTKLLVTNGADINARDGLGESPLHLAVRQGNESMVKLLLKEGADVNTWINENDVYDDAQRILSRPRHESIMRLLIEGGANVNACGGGLRTALEVASSNPQDHKCQAVVRFLRKMGAADSLA